MSGFIDTIRFQVKEIKNAKAYHSTANLTVVITSTFYTIRSYSLYIKGLSSQGLQN